MSSEMRLCSGNFEYCDGECTNCDKNKYSVANHIDHPNLLTFIGTCDLGLINVSKTNMVDEVNKKYANKNAQKELKNGSIIVASARCHDSDDEEIHSVFDATKVMVCINESKRKRKPKFVFYEMATLEE